MENLKKLKIFFVVTKSNFGGAQRYVYDLATNLPKNQYEAVVISGSCGILTDKLREAGVKTICLSGLKRDIDLLKEILSLWQLFKNFISQKPDVVHLNSSKAGGLGALAARIAGVKKIVFTAHGWAFGEDRNLANRVIIKFLSWLTILFSHKVITVSEKDRVSVSDWPLAENKVVAIHNGIQPIEFYEKNDALKKLLGYAPANEITIIGTIAELHKNKGLAYSIMAVSQMKEKIIYLIIGEGEERETLETIIKNNGAENKIFILGSKDMAYKYLKAFDIFILPSIKEGLSYALLEAGLAELAIIVTRVGGNPEVIDDKTNGLLVEPKNMDQIIQTLTLLIYKKELRKNLGKAIKNKVSKEFSLEDMLKKTIGLYL